MLFVETNSSGILVNKQLMQELSDKQVVELQSHSRNLEGIVIQISMCDWPTFFSPV